MSLAGKVAIVTGANRGIGAGLALDLAERGVNVVVDYPPGADPRAVMSTIQGDAIAVEADVTRTEDRQLLVQSAVDRFGRVDVLVNNAGLDLGPVPFLTFSEENFDAIFHLNVKGMFFLSQTAALQMVKQGSGGRIIQITSVHGERTFRDRCAYAASKGAVNAMTRGLALDLAPHGITVNAIAPGYIEVERTKGPDYDREAVGRRIPGGRVGFPKDIAEAVAFLASDEASYVTGHVLNVDGGMSAALAY
jgi:NAD(P)-dependent dehydrogenase (short-subunit alcohol dehydrogenase family)